MKIKKIVYLVHLNFGLKSGVMKKVIDTCDAWEKMGIHARIFLLTPNPNLKSELLRIKNVRFHIFEYNGNLSKMYNFHLLISEMIKFDPEAVYYRYQSYIPGYSRLARSFPFFIDINSDDIRELKFQTKLTYNYNLLTRNIIFKKAKGLIFVTNELSQKKVFTKYKKPTLVLGNGINLKRIEPLNPPNNKYPRLVFIGSVNQLWNGIDKISLLAKFFPKWKFEIIGPSKSEFSNIRENITVHGYLEQDEYVNILRRCDGAIGTLALHRKNLNEASPLKILEYLAFGLPVITGFIYTEIPQKTPFFLRLPNEENNIEPYKDKIESFIYSWMGKRVKREDIIFIDSLNKEKKRIHFIENILNK